MNVNKSTCHKYNPGKAIRKTNILIIFLKNIYQFIDYDFFLLFILFSILNFYSFSLHNDELPTFRPYMLQFNDGAITHTIQSGHIVSLQFQNRGQYWKNTKNLD